MKTEVKAMAPFRGSPEATRYAGGTSLKKNKYNKRPKYHVHPLMWLFLYLKNRKKKYTLCDINYIAQNKKSDILFVLGAGVAINGVTSDEWNLIKRFDSLGMNLFIFHDFIPTYCYSEINRNPYYKEQHAKLIQSKAKDYRKVIRFVSSRVWKQGLKPRLQPQFFIDDQTVCLFEYPAFVECPPTRPFKQEDFNGKYMYRSSLNLVLYIAYKMKYKKIVLLGCEMKPRVYFFEGRGEAEWVEIMSRKMYPTIPWDSKENRKSQLYEGLYESKGKHPLDVAIYAFNDFVLKPTEIELYVGRRESILYPKIPYLDIMSLKKNE